MTVALAAPGCGAAGGTPSAPVTGAANAASPVASELVVGSDLGGNIGPPRTEFLRLFTCDGADVAPRVKWTAPPAATKGFALRMTDLDTPSPGFTHWLLYGIDGAARNMLETTSSHPVEGMNDFGVNGYRGPCPPRGQRHRYEIDVYALDRQVVDGPGLSLDQFNARLKGHVVASGKTEATDQR